jgi:bifunctional DNA-binding transcriptional regulator/antitoxin component of YhaV-PrlF toxin-antitoxin module
VIIPKSVRDAHDWQAGMTFDICEHGEGILLRPSRPFPQTSLDDVAGCLNWSGPVVTIDEMNEAVAREARRRTHSGSRKS